MRVGFSVSPFAIAASLALLYRGLAGRFLVAVFAHTPLFMALRRGILRQKLFRRVFPSQSFRPAARLSRC